VSTDLIRPDAVSQPPRGIDGRVSPEDGVDPELLALPPPPRAQLRLTVTLLVLVSLAASSMAHSLRDDVAYALAPATDIDVGDLYSFDSARAGDNRCIRAHGALGGALAVRFERPFEADTYRISPVMGRRDLWVEVRVPSGEEGARYVPPRSFRGRLVRWSKSGLRHRGLERAVAALTKQTIPPDAWLVVDGESPRAARWALALALMFAGFAVWSVATTVRLLRRVS